MGMPLTHLSGLSKDGSGCEGWQDSSLHSPDSSSPCRNSCTQGSNSGGCAKSSSPDNSREPVAFEVFLMGVGSREGSPTLGSSNVTFFFNLLGQGETVCLLNGCLLPELSASGGPYVSSSWNASCFLNAIDCLIALGSFAIPVRQSSQAILCAIPILPWQPTPGSGHPSLP